MRRYDCNLGRRDHNDDGNPFEGALYAFLLSAPLYAGLFLLIRWLVAR